MINSNYRNYYTSNLFGNSPKTASSTMTSQERKKLNKMEEKFISEAKAGYEKKADDVNIENVKEKVDKINEGDPFAGLTEEDAEKLKEMRQQYTNGIRQKKQEIYDKEYEKASNEHNKELAKIEAKCEQIARVIASGKNYSKGDARYLGKNNPTSLASALMQRSLAEMFKKDDDEKPKKLTNKDDKNYDDLEAPEPQFAGELTKSELKGLPTATDLPNYETDYATTSTPTSNTYSQSGGSTPTTSSPSVDISM